MNVNWWSVPEKLVDSIQVKVSLPAPHRGVAKNHLRDVFLPDEAGYGPGHCRRLQLNHLRTHCFGEAHVGRQRPLVGLIVIHSDIDINNV